MSARDTQLPVRRPIELERLAARPFQVFDKGWFLLTAGDHASGVANSMTVSWGGFGTLWHRPFALVVVRPTRHTYGFMERHPTFTLCAFPERHRAALEFMGTHSGRDTDKVAASGLTLAASTVVAAPCYAEAELVLECRKLYWHDLAPGQFLDPAIDQEYPRKDYHRAYLGEVVAVAGTDAWRI